MEFVWAPFWHAALISLAITGAQGIDFKQYKSCADCIGAGYGWCPIRRACGGFANRQCTDDERAFAPDHPSIVKKQAEVEGRTHVRSLQKSSFDEVVSSGRCVLVQFYAPWCGHCKALAPDYEKLGKAFAAEHGVAIIKVDGTAETDLAGKFGVKGYPTLKLIPPSADGSGKSYEGERDLSSMVEFVNKECDTFRRPNGSPDIGPLEDLFLSFSDHPPADVKAFAATARGFPRNDIEREGVKRALEAIEKDGIEEVLNEARATSKAWAKRTPGDQRDADSEYKKQVATTQITQALLASAQPLSKWSVKQLKKEAGRLGISLEGSTDKSEMRERLRPRLDEIATEKKQDGGGSLGDLDRLVDEVARKKNVDLDEYESDISAGRLQEILDQVAKRPERKEPRIPIPIEEDNQEPKQESGKGKGRATGSGALSGGIGDRLARIRSLLGEIEEISASGPEDAKEAPPARGKDCKCPECKVAGQGQGKVDGDVLSPQWKTLVANLLDATGSRKARANWISQLFNDENRPEEIAQFLRSASEE